MLHGDTASLAQGHGHLRIAVARRRRHRAGQRLRQGAATRPRSIAAAMLEVSPDDLEWSDGRWSVRGDPDQGKTIGEIAFAAFAAHNLPDGVEPSLDSDATYDPDNFSFPHGTHLCAVEVDTETGPGAHPLLRGGRRRGRRGEPADRRGPGARRDRPGHRAGAVRGGRVRLLGQPGDRLARRLPDPVGGRPAVVHHRADDHAVHDSTRSASRASARRARSRPPRPWSTPSSTRCARSAWPTCRCRARQNESGEPSRKPAGQAEGAVR